MEDPFTVKTESFKLQRYCPPKIHKQHKDIYFLKKYFLFRIVNKQSNINSHCDIKLSGLFSFNHRIIGQSPFPLPDTTSAFYFATLMVVLMEHHNKWCSLVVMEHIVTSQFDWSRDIKCHPVLTELH